MRVVVLARSLPLCGQSLSHGAHGAAACGAALALLPPAQSFLRARCGVTLGRRSSAAAARSLGAVRRAQRLTLFACGRWRGRFSSVDGRRRAALTAPLPAAPRWRTWRRVCRVTAIAAAWQSASTLLWRRSALLARCVVLSGSRLCVWSLTLSLPLWTRSPSRGAHGAATCGAALALLVPAQSCRRARGGGTLGRHSSAATARAPETRRALSACICRRRRVLSWRVAVARLSRRRADKENELSVIAGQAAEPDERPTELSCPPAESRAASVESPRSQQSPPAPHSSAPFDAAHVTRVCLFVCASPCCCSCPRSRHTSHRCLSARFLSAKLFCGLWL